MEWNTYSMQLEPEEDEDDRKVDLVNHLANKNYSYAN